MGAELGETYDPEWARKAEHLRQAINTVLWTGDRYRFLTGPFGASDRQEALGNAYALLFGVADETRCRAVLCSQTVMPACVPAVFPDYPRYLK